MSTTSHEPTPQPAEKDSYAASIDGFLASLNASTSRNGGDRQLSRADFLDSLNRCFSSLDGKIILAWLHATAGTRKPAFAFGGSGGESIALAAATRDGRRGLVWEIEANLEDARSSSPGDKPVARKTRTGRRGSGAVS